MDIGCIQVGTKELLDRGQALTGLRRSCYDVFAVSEYPSKNLLDNKSSIQSQFKAYLIQAMTTPSKPIRTRDLASCRGVPPWRLF